ncbi:MAG: hypothetical protein ABR986_10620 [Methanomassiliicoccales archaeon]
MDHDNEFILQLKGEVEKRNKTIKAYNFLVAFIEKPAMDKIEQAGKSLRILDSAIEQNGANDPALEALRSLVESARSVSAQLQATTRDEFGKKIQEEMGKVNLSLTGHFPILKVSYYDLEIDFSKNSVIIWWGPRQEKVSRCRCDGLEVTQKVLEHIQGLRKNAFDPKEHIGKLLQAYRAVVAKEGKKMGDPVPIVQVHLETLIMMQGRSFIEEPSKQSFTDYGRCTFSFDLYRMMNSGCMRCGNLEMGVTTSTFAKTNRRGDFIWIPTNETGEGATRSDILFREAVQ